MSKTVANMNRFDETTKTQTAATHNTPIKVKGFLSDDHFHLERKRKVESPNLVMIQKVIQKKKVINQQGIQIKRRYEKKRTNLPDV